MNAVVLRGLLIVTIFASVVMAQDTDPTVGVAVIRTPPVSAPPSRIVSPHLAELLAASMPRYQPTPERPESTAPVNQESEKPLNGIVRLPRIIVSDSKLPKPMEVLTKNELERYAMDHYIGPEDGLDRGFLNLFTIAGIWKKIPVLGSFPFLTSETNRDRGMRLYETAERKRKMDDLMGLMNLAKDPVDGSVPEK